jgi:hypothetical protein
MGYITFLAEFLGILLFFISIFVLFKRENYRAIVQVISGSIFGITLEFMNVFLMSTYTYSSSFFLQLNNPPDNIPIVIGLCWGLIIFACMSVSNNVKNIPEWSRPLIDGFLALTIDFSMDTIAIRLDGGFWNWIDIPMETLPSLNGFFGVNYGNFTGWFFVVVIFSSLIRFEKFIFLERLDVNPVISLFFYCCAPFIAYPLLFLSFHVLPIPIFLVLDDDTPQGILGLIILIYVLILAIIILCVVFIRSKFTIEKNGDLLAFSIFIFFHLSYLFFFFLEGLWITVPLILLLGVLMLIIDLSIHWLIFDKKEIKRFLNS